jgi:hypothetical protein
VPPSRGPKRFDGGLRPISSSDVRVPDSVPLSPWVSGIGEDELSDLADGFDFRSVGRVAREQGRVMEPPFTRWNTFPTLMALGKAFPAC